MTFPVVEFVLIALIQFVCRFSLQGKVGTSIPSVGSALQSGCGSSGNAIPSDLVLQVGIEQLAWWEPTFNLFFFAQVLGLQPPSWAPAVGKHQNLDRSCLGMMASVTPHASWLVTSP